MSSTNYKNWGRGLMVFFLCQSGAFADDSKSKNLNLSTQEINLNTTMPLGASKWYQRQPLWQTHEDLTVESFDFEDRSALKRLTKLRSLSLVTFAQTKNTRLFLGVNDDGMVGLHFSAFPRYGHDRHLSLWSMPYVDEPAAVEDNLGREQKQDQSSDNVRAAADVEIDEVTPASD